MNPMKKHITKMNTKLENMTYLVDNKKNLCHNNKFHPFTDRKVKLIPETIYRDIEIFIQHDSQKYITPECADDLSNQKLTNCDIESDQFC